jgi:hypothetical protein
MSELSGWFTEVDGSRRITRHGVTGAANMREHRIRKREMAEVRQEMYREAQAEEAAEMRAESLAR